MRTVTATCLAYTTVLVICSARLNRYICLCNQTPMAACTLDPSLASLRGLLLRLPLFVFVLPGLLCCQQQW